MDRGRKGGVGGEWEGGGNGGGGREDWARLAI